MRLRDKIICFLCVVLAVGLFIVAGSQLDDINDQRREMKLVSNEPLENAPPSLAFATVAMGAFRGLVVDVLWMRAERLKQQGQFFDAKQLAEWITTLQPRFGEVWVFQAWNMAYNISVAMPDTQPQERWKWVQNGYQLLRDQGIPQNPRNISIYLELARIFQHKIGGISDESHKYYKIKLAESMQALLGPADRQYFEALAEAPADLQQIEADEKVAEIINKLSAADSIFTDKENLTNNYLTLRQNPQKFEPNAFAVIDAFRGSKALEKLDIFAKANHLRNQWKLDPAHMQKLNKKYGPVDYDDPNNHLPLDWRHPDTHAIYWASKGLEMAATGQYSPDESRTDRMLVQSLQNLYRNGTIYIYQEPVPIAPDAQNQSARQAYRKQIFLRPDLRMFMPYHEAALAGLEKYEKLKQGSYAGQKIGHKNMLTNAIFSFYQAGHIKQAQRVLNILRQYYPSPEHDAPLVTFVRNRLKKELVSIGLKDAKEMIELLLRESYFRYAMRDDDEAASREKIAKDVYDLYQAPRADVDRINLPDFKMLRYFALQDFFSDPQYPVGLRRALVGRIKVEKPELAEQFKQHEMRMIQQQQQQNQ